MASKLSTIAITRPPHGIASPFVPLRVARAVVVLMVRERELARELEQRVVVFADDVGAKLRVALDPLPVRHRELLALAQDFRRTPSLPMSCSGAAFCIISATSGFAPEACAISFA